MKSLAKNIIRRLGYELRRYAPTSSERAQLMTIIRSQGINLIFDVGANTGGFGTYIRELGYDGRIVSFEPTKVAHEQLLIVVKNDPHWLVAARSAIGNINGEVEINISGNSESSSILPMLDSHTKAAPTSSYVGKEVVPLRTLDTLCPEYINKGDRLFLKIDTQGYEEQVLKGAKNTVAAATVLQMELSLIPLYAGQKLMPEMISLLRDAGYDLWGIAPVFADPTSGRILQMDGIFCKSA